MNYLQAIELSSCQAFMKNSVYKVVTDVSKHKDIELLLLSLSINVNVYILYFIKIPC